MRLPAKCKATMLNKINDEGGTFFHNPLRLMAEGPLFAMRKEGSEKDVTFLYNKKRD